MRPCNKLPSKVLPSSIGSPESRPGKGIEKGGPMLWGLMGIAWMTPTKTETVWEDMHDHRIFMNILHFTWTCFGMKRPLCDFPYILSCILAEMVHSGKRPSFFSSTAVQYAWREIKQEVEFSIEKIVLCCLCFKVFQSCLGIMFLFPESCNNDIHMDCHHMQSKMESCNNLSFPHPFHRSEHGWHLFHTTPESFHPFPLEFRIQLVSVLRFGTWAWDRQPFHTQCFRILGCTCHRIRSGCWTSLVGIVEWTKLLPKATEGGFL